MDKLQTIFLQRMNKDVSEYISYKFKGLYFDAILSAKITQLRMKNTITVCGEMARIGKEEAVTDCKTRHSLE
jgi:hypothetical protein